MQELADFEDGQVLTTLLPDMNLTVHVDITNDTETVTLESFGALSTIVTPPQYACNVSIHLLFVSCIHTWCKTV